MFLIFIFGCKQNIKNNNLENETDIYTAKSDFWGISNTIPTSILDSLILTLPYSRLDKFKTTDAEECHAVDFLKKELALKGHAPDEFIVYEIKRDKNFIFSFFLNHIDYYVYKYNLNKTNSELSNKPSSDGSFEEIPPITGNISGFEGWYSVDIEKKSFKISYVQ